MPFNDTCPFCKKKFVKTDEITIESNVIYHKKCVLEQYEIAEKREKQHLIDLITEDTYNKIEDNFGWIPGDIEDWEKLYTISI